MSKPYVSPILCKNLDYKPQSINQDVTGMYFSEMAGLKLNPAFPPQAVAAAPGAPLPVQQFRPVSKASQLVVSVTPGMSPSSSQTVTPTHSPQPSHVHPTSPAGSVTDLSTDKLRLQRLQMQRQHIQREEEELYKKVQLQVCCLYIKCTKYT